MRSAAPGDACVCSVRAGDGDFDVDDVDALFDACDSDGSGSVTFEEIRVELNKRLNEAAAEAVALQLVGIADEDGSGAISRPELHEGFVKIQAGKAAPGAPSSQGDFERSFDGWLGATFVPRAIRAATKKKLL